MHSRAFTVTCSLALLLIGAMFAAARSAETVAPPSASAPPALADLSWMEGKWVREETGAYLEETWSSPVNNSLYGMFRWNRDGKPWMCEFMSITLEGEKPVFRLRHFNPALKPWEKELPLTYPLKTMSANEVVFEDPQSAADHPRRFVYKRTGDTLTVRLENADGSGDVFDFTLTTRTASGDGAKPQAAGEAGSSPLGFTGGLVLRFTVTDRAKSRDWYRDVLGFEVLFEVDEIGWTEMTNHAAKLTIGLSQSPAVSTSTGTMPVIGVSNLDATRTHLESKGVKFTGPTIEHAGLVRLATLLDPDGHQIMLYQALGD
jgi:predicted enzyme related to lactoylglutathione lyase